MAIYRMVQMAFWSDTKIIDDFTPEDRYFFLYLLTNCHTNLCGCYEIAVKQMADESGYSTETVKKLLHRLSNVHGVIAYSSTKELMIWNWYKFNWTSSEKFRKPLNSEILQIKDDTFRKYLTDILNGDTVSADERYPIDTSVTVTVTDTVSATNTATDKNKVKIEEIVSYLNNRAGTSYRANGKQTASHINARLAEGYTVDDFITVIDKKCDAWLNDEKMAKYIRPETLFGSKFEAYLNERKAVRSGDRFLAELEEIYRSETYGE